MQAFHIHWSLEFDKIHLIWAFMYKIHKFKCKYSNIQWSYFIILIRGPRTRADQIRKFLEPVRSRTNNKSRKISDWMVRGPGFRGSPIIWWQLIQKKSKRNAHRKSDLDWFKGVFSRGWSVFNDKCISLHYLYWTVQFEREW